LCALPTTRNRDPIQRTLQGCEPFVPKEDRTDGEERALNEDITLNEQELEKNLRMQREMVSYASDFRRQHDPVKSATHTAERDKFNGDQAKWDDRHDPPMPKLTIINKGWSVLDRRERAVHFKIDAKNQKERIARVELEKEQRRGRWVSRPLMVHPPRSRPSKRRVLNYHSETSVFNWEGTSGSEVSVPGTPTTTNQPRIPIEGKTEAWSAPIPTIDYAARLKLAFYTSSLPYDSPGGWCVFPRHAPHKWICHSRI
jgi:hypothetical protein